MRDFDEFEKELIRDKKISKAEYAQIMAEYRFVANIIQKRLDAKMTQGQLAKKAGTRQSAISRLESGDSNPSIGFLSKIAEALNSKLTITFERK